MSLNIITELSVRINLIPVTFSQEKGKVYFSWFSFRTFLNVSILTGLALITLIYYVPMSTTFVKATPMEYAR